MYIYLMVFIISCTTALCSVFLKKFQQETDESFLTLCLLNLINAVTACIFFFIINKFKINMNMPTFIFSALASVIVCANIVLNLFALSNVSLAVAGIITTAGTLIGTTVFGNIILNEVIGIRLIIAIILTLTAVALPFLRDIINKKNSSQKHLNGKRGFIICLLLFIFSGLNVILNKMYTQRNDVCDSNSYFFMLNFILAVACILVLAIYKAKTKIQLKSIATALITKQSLYIVWRTLSSNFGAILTMIVLIKMDVSIYTMLTTSVAVVLNSLASRYIFKEKMPLENKVAVIITVIAICLVMK